jgi:hypothetical protein
MGEPTNVRFGFGGTISVAPAGTAIPADASTPLAAAYQDVGLISDAGFTLGKSVTTADLKAWGAGVVRTTITDSALTAQFSMLETNEASLQLWLGAPNTGTAPAVEFAIPGQPTNDESVLVIDWHENYAGVDHVFRLVFPRAAIDSYQDVAVNTDNAVEYQITMKGLSDATGNAAYYHTNAASAPVPLLAEEGAPASAGYTPPTDQAAA